MTLLVDAQRYYNAFTQDAAPYWECRIRCKRGFIWRYWSNLIGARKRWLLCDSRRNLFLYILLSVTDSITTYNSCTVNNFIFSHCCRKSINSTDVLILLDVNIWSYFELVRQILSRTVRNFFHFLPISYLLDIRTAKFLENVVRNENCVCKLFAHNAQCSLNKIFSSYGADIIAL